MHGLMALAMLLAAGRATAAAPARLDIDGAIPAPMTLSAADLAAMPRTSVTWTLHGNTMACEGVRLADVLARAGVAAGEAVRGPALGLVVSATASDGYRALFTIGELDHLLGNAPVIVADHCNGAALPASDGPIRLVAAGDKRGARSVGQLVRLTIIALPLPAK